MSELKVNSIVDANSGNTAQINGMTPTADSLQGFRNRILNGGMVIDQRHAGAAVNADSATNPYTVDRWRSLALTGSGQFSVQQSTTAPTGFTNSLLFTSLAATSVGASDAFGFRQAIEGLNCADLGFGTAAASSVTLSFWVRSSLTGTFGGSLANNAANRSYPFVYTVSSANTWEQKTVTVPGDTTGTWATNNTTGINVWFGLGVGATRSGTAGAWAASDFRSATGAVSLIGTSGATFYITGAQLEAGSVATPFERRPFGTELALCQRYYYRLVPAASSSNTLGVGRAELSTVANTLIFFPTVMRAAPTGLEQSGTAGDYAVRFTNGGIATCSSVPTFSDANTSNAAINLTVSSGLTGGQSVAGRAVNTNAFLAWSAEL
jgi:hypothetical protein